jgi:hypothetical protein
MSQHIKIYQTVLIRVKDEGKVLIKPSKQIMKFLTKEQLKEEMTEIFTKNGWEKDNDKFIKKEGKDITIIYQPDKEILEVKINKISKEKVKISNAEEEEKKIKEHSSKAASSVIHFYLEHYQEEFKRRYIPEMVAQGLIKRAKNLDPSAKIEMKKDSKDELSLTISLEVK